MRKPTSLVPAIAALLWAASPADATMVFTVGNTTISVSDEGLAGAAAAEAAFLSGLSGVITESFEDFAAGTRADAIPTNVGTFFQLAEGNGGLCEGVSCGGLLIDSLLTPPAYVGRFPLDGTRWLDSNDSIESRWQRTALEAPTALGFYMTDPNDQGARIDVSGNDASENSFLVEDIFGGPLSSGAVFYITIVDPDGIDLVDFIQLDPEDGWGIDRFTIGDPSVVPEPATLALLGVSLLALWRAQRRRS